MFSVYKVVSFDLFLTLADLNSCVRTLWSRIFSRPVSAEEAVCHAEHLKRIYLPNYYALHNQPFQPMAAVFRRGFEEYFAEAGMDLDPGRAAEIFLDEHNRCPILPDAAAVLPLLAGRYRIVISSDADVCMVRDLLPQIPHEAAFISEEMGVYKGNRTGAFFRQVIEKTGVRPEEILHVGDGRSDVIGAKLCGVPVYFVDRDGRGLAPEVAERPDMTGRDLYGLLPVLGLDAPV